MKRYYLCRRIGDGSHDNPWRSELREWIYANYPDYRRIENKFIWQIIGHTCQWVLMVWDLEDSVHDLAMATLTGIFSFPSDAVDTPFANLAPQVRNAIKNKLVAAGLDDAWILDTTTLYEIIEYVAHSIQISFWADFQITNRNFDTRTPVANLNSAQKERLRASVGGLGIDPSFITDASTMSSIVRKVQENDDGSPRLFRNGKRWLFYDR